MKGIRIVWKSHISNSKKGYLRISVRNSEINKTKIISLKLPPISERHFDKIKQRVKSSFKDYETYNNEIENILKEYDIRKDTYFIKDEKKTLNFFVENFLIPSCKSQGTKEKYKNILNLLNLFYKSKYNKNEILLKSINVGFINEWKIWLRTDRKLTENTISYKTKTFSSFISKSINQGYYIFIPNPFKSVKNVINRNPVEYLTEKELERLINTELFEIVRTNKKIGEKKDDLSKRNHKNNFSINEVRLWFLFQLFQHGKRISDLITLRWNNFYFDENELRINKRMIKTKHTIKSMVYYPSMYILMNYIPKDIITEEEEIEINNLKSINNHLKESINENNYSKGDKIQIKFRNIFNFEFEKLGENYLISEGCIDETITNITNSIKNKDKRLMGITEIEDFDFDIEDKINNDERLIQLIKLKNHIINERESGLKSRLELTEDTNNKLYNLLTTIILRLKNHKEYSRNFVFPLLDNGDFSDIKKEEDFDSMTEKQYLRFVGRRGYYNRLLRQVGNQCGISNLTSHKSRHSYTSLIIKYNENINLYDLMESLGHKNLSTTQSYIQNFINRRVDVIGKGFSDKFINNIPNNILKL
jgi:integrase